MEYPGRGPRGLVERANRELGAVCIRVHHKRTRLDGLILHSGIDTEHAARKGGWARRKKFQTINNWQH